MTFDVDTNWPVTLRTILKTSREENASLEGLYTTLFNYSFCSGDNLSYFVAAEDKPEEDLNHAGCDFIVFLVDEKEESLKPVLVAEIEEDSWVSSANTRLKADQRMRNRFDRMLRQCPLPQMYGLSLLGTSLRIYRADVATGQVDPISKGDPDSLSDNLLEGEWSLDILSQDGFKKMGGIVSYIHAESAKVEGQ
ncbi:hypothetical protein M422DRAFT_34943 [Sphaerobolus stellatus SS14]|uniref:Fungal-type protein kinase domain-containing protein n=1 Tax=Sphaerobolus stellatus (strain SS14) TaxID=990650 RepID=A0A0C9TWT9_SPHS4|nr:hypothetical protein M422DRAFT_34943 [Sphaerobolus stellatus SS14]